MPVLLQTMLKSVKLPNSAENSDCCLHFISVEFWQEKNRENSVNFIWQTIFYRSHTFKHEFEQNNGIENTARLILHFLNSN